MGLTIAILAHRDLGWLQQNYNLYAIGRLWREAGHRVRLLQGPPEEFFAADLMIVHVDTTCVPADHLAYARRYARTVNAWGPGSVDASKRLICADQLVRRGEAAAGGWRGPVIAKTDLNSGGIIEAHLAERAGRPAGLWMRSRDYRVFSSEAEVPAEIWENAQWVVTRFLPEIEGELYALRVWVFCGDQHTHTRWFGSRQILKSVDFVRSEPLGEVPAELKARRRALGLDFGKIDYVMYEGRPVLLDLNRTPMWGAVASKVMQPRMQMLADGWAR